MYGWFSEMLKRRMWMLKDDDDNDGDGDGDGDGDEQVKEGAKVRVQSEACLTASVHSLKSAEWRQYMNTFRQIQNKITFLNFPLGRCWIRTAFAPLSPLLVILSPHHHHSQPKLTTSPPHL